MLKALAGFIIGYWAGERRSAVAPARTIGRVGLAWRVPDLNSDFGMGACRFASGASADPRCEPWRNRPVERRA
jgi:hypothetical protein